MDKLDGGPIRLHPMVGSGELLTTPTSPALEEFIPGVFSDSVDPDDINLNNVPGEDIIVTGKRRMLLLSLSLVLSP